MKKVIVSIMLLAMPVALLLPDSADATAVISENTGLACSACHVNQLGGGELTVLGRAYLDEVLKGAAGAGPSPVKRVVRLLVGYLHILAGVVWFGTIFYVHILLKPAYASKGLPRGELVLGWTCIIVIAVTGTLLSIARMGSLAAFYQTSFGILLSVKISLFVVMATIAGIATFVVGPKLKAKMGASRKNEGLLTVDELSAFDGRDGNKAYVGVDGVVYDVTASGLWKDGRHMRHHAGSDMSSAIRQAPHGLEKLEGLPIVGMLSPDAPMPPAGGPKKAFYIMAYLNLALVFLILGIIAVWRWW